MAAGPQVRPRERLAAVVALLAGAALWVGAPALGGSDGPSSDGSTPAASELSSGSPFAVDPAPTAPDGTTPDGTAPDGTTPQGDERERRGDCPDKGGDGRGAPDGEAPTSAETPAL